MQVFTGERESILSTITQNLRKDGSNKERKIVDGQINIENAFPSFPWDKIKNQIISSFEKFGTICSIAIGMWTILTFIKNLLFNCFNCCLIRQVSEGLINSLLILTNPSTYLLRKMKKDSKKPQDDEEATPFKKQKEQKRSSELYNLRKLNEKLSLPGYSEKM